MALLHEHHPGLELLRLALLDVLLWGVLPHVVVVVLVGGMFRPYIGYRSRSGGPVARPARRGWERVT